MKPVIHILSSDGEVVVVPAYYMDNIRTASIVGRFSPTEGWISGWTAKVLLQLDGAFIL